MRISLSVFFTVWLIVASLFAQDQSRTAHNHPSHERHVPFTPADGGKRGGLARVMTIKKEALKENPNTIMTLGGDTLSRRSNADL